MNGRQRTYSIRISSGRQKLVSVDDFSLQEGKITFLFGESGIGKSLISKAVYGLLDPEELDVTVNGEDYRLFLRRNETRAIQQFGFFVFQEPSTHLNPLLRLEEQLREGSLAGAPSETSILSRLWDSSSYRGVTDLLRVYPKPDRPSGGEKQRVLLTMAFKKIALLKDTPSHARSALYVFDEPSGNLDNHFRDQFLSILCEYHRQFRFTAVVITHDYSMITSLHRHQKDMLSAIAFREVFRKHQRLAVRDFAPSVYTQWADSLQPAVMPRQLSAPIIEFESGARVFGKTLVISKDANGTSPCALSIAPGMIAALKAPSGTGKTTLVKMIMGMSATARFRMTFCGEVLTHQMPRFYWRKHLWGKMMTMVFQHADEALNPSAAVKDIFHGLAEPAIRELLSEWFPDNTDPGFWKKRVRYLSGGEKQRLNLLRSLSLQTDLLILDEPLNGLDFESMTRVLTMLRMNQRKAQAVLIISHNDDVFDRLVPAEQTYYLHAR
ncbi:MAG: ATP-binding cassette domain-containing protein [Ignavibacteriales bacterium]|nr:ATP-binding cassette domain-containing protein [Ignavibacteriales bacterium]